MLIIEEILKLPFCLSLYVVKRGLGFLHILPVVVVISRRRLAEPVGFELRQKHSFVFVVKIGLL